MTEFLIPVSAEFFSYNLYDNASAAATADVNVRANRYIHL